MTNALILVRHPFVLRHGVFRRCCVLACRLDDVRFELFLGESALDIVAGGPTLKCHRVLLRVRLLKVDGRARALM